MQMLIGKGRVICTRRFWLSGGDDDLRDAGRILGFWNYKQKNKMQRKYDLLIKCILNSEGWEYITHPIRRHTTLSL